MRFIEEVARDVRFAARNFRRTPVVTTAAILSIAIGIAAMTAVYGVVDAALFRPLPLARSDRLAALYITKSVSGKAVERQRWSWPRFQLLARQTKSFENVASFSQSVLAITSGGAEPVNAEIVSSSYFGVLRIKPVLGRAFDSTEDDPATTHAIALIGYDLWQRRFEGNRTVIGQSVTINNVPVTIIGVLPEDFSGLTGRSSVWLPPTMPHFMSYADYQNTNQNFISVVGRLRDGEKKKRSPRGFRPRTTTESRSHPINRIDPLGTKIFTAPVAESAIRPSTGPSLRV